MESHISALGANVGRVAVARAMLKTIDVMVKKGDVFRPTARVNGMTGQRRGAVAG